MSNFLQETDKMAPEEQPIALEAHEYVLQAKYYQQQQNEAAFQIQVLIETLYKTIESLTTEKRALQEENEALQTQVKDLTQNYDHRLHTLQNTQTTHNTPPKDQSRSQLML